MNNLNIFSDRTKIREFETEYKSFVPKNPTYKKEYFLESKGAVRINKSRPFDLIIHNAELFEEIGKNFRALDDLISYRSRCENKRVEQENEIDISKIPFSFILLTIVSILI
jgi:hypothetical protein